MDRKPVASVLVEPGDQTVTVGGTATFSARALASDGTDVSCTFTWSSTDTQVASSIGTGGFTGVAAGATLVTATCDGISGSAFLTVNNPVPTLTSLSPSSTDAGSAGLLLTVTGSGFVQGSTVRWNGSTRTTAYLSGTQLMATIPSGDLASGGTAQVTVANPAPGGGTSGSLTFTIVQTLGQVSGSVTDPFGGPLSGVRVELLKGSTLVTQATTGTPGSFEFRDRPVGDYTLRASKSGYVTASAAVTISSTPTTAPAIRLQPQSLPSGGTQSVRVVAWDAQTMTFEADVFVVDPAGAPVTGLPASAFTLDGFTSGSTTISFTRQSVTTTSTAAQGPFSAAMLMDQSGSIRDTDPNHSRLQAAKIFLDALGSGDRVVLSAFASSGRLPFELTVYGSFTADGRSYFSTLDQLAGLVDGGTPLYRSTLSMIDYTAQNGPTQNKAVLVFTDGEDTNGGATINDIAQRAAATGVKVFTIALSNNVDVSVLAEIASRTGGSLLWASDARQLISMYGTLGNLLRGGVSLYRTRWTATISPGSWTPGSWIVSYIRVDVPNGPVWIPFRAQIPASSVSAAPAAASGGACASGPGRRPFVCVR